MTILKVESNLKGRTLHRTPPPVSLSAAEVEQAACRTLGVAPGTEAGELRAAWHRLALEHHPDKLRMRLGREPSDEEVAAAESRFNEIQDAYEVLRERAAAGQPDDPRSARRGQHDVRDEL